MNYRFLVFAIIVLLSSCNKDKQIQRHLYNKTGKWKIINQKESFYINDSLTEVNSYSNYGIILFSKIGSYQWNEDNFSDYTIGKWSATSTEITFESPELRVFKVKDHSRKEILMESTEIQSVGGSIYKAITEISLNKLK